MTRHDTLRLLEQTLLLDANALTGAEQLGELQAWDSLSVVAFIAMADQHFGRPLSGNRVAGCRSVQDLLALLGFPAVRRAA